MRLIFRLTLWFLLLVIVALAALRAGAILREDADATTLAPPDGQFVMTADGTIFTLSAGRSDAPTLLFAHGTAAWSGFWRHTLNDMAERDYRAVAFDMPPFGFSDHDPAHDYSRVRSSERLIALLAALERPPVVVGHSFGAGAVVEAAMRRPDLFAGLVIVDGALGLGTAPDARMPTVLRPVVIRQTAVSATASNPLLIRRFLSGLVHVKSAASAEAAEILKHPFKRQDFTEEVAHWLPILLSYPDGALSIRPENYRELAVPTAIIWGEQDTATPLAQGQQLHDLIPGSALYVLDGVGHIPHIEAPEIFADTLQRAVLSLANDG